MKVIDATRDHSAPMWRAWRRRLHGAVTRTLSSSTPRETWRAALPALAAAAKKAMRAGIDLDRAARLLELVGPSVSEPLAFLDVCDVVLLDDEQRGAA